MSELIDQEVKIALTRKQGAFAPLTDAEIEGLSQLLVEKKFRAGEEIVREGDRVDSVYLIVEGNADVRHITVQNGSLHVESLATLQPGDSIGLSDSGFYSLSGLRTATVVANNDMVTLRLSIPQFHGFALDNSHVNEVMRKHLEHL